VAKEITPSTIGSLMDYKLISIVENPKKWDRAVVEAAKKEIASRGGLIGLKEGIQDDKEVETKTESAGAKEGNGLVKLGMTFIIVLGLTLPFHYVLTGNPSVFPKENLSLSNTFIFESDIDNIISRYNTCGYQEQLIILQEPLVKKLFEKGYILKTTERDKPHE